MSHEVLMLDELKRIAKALEDLVEIERTQQPVFPIVPCSYPQPTNQPWSPTVIWSGTAQPYQDQPANYCCNDGVGG
jgi:hypothetical protein